MLLSKGLELLAYSAYSSFLWRLRGGAWQNIGIKFGTNWTRLVTGILLSVPFVFISWKLSLVLPFGILLGLIVAGWGPFMGMGNHVIDPPWTWIAYLPLTLKFKPQSVMWDITGMTACGWIFFIFTLPAFLLVPVSWPFLVLAGLIGGLGFSFSYYSISRISLPELPILDGLDGNGIIAGHGHEQWSEFAVGLIVGTIFFLLAVGVS